MMLACIIHFERCHERYSLSYHEYFFVLFHKMTDLQVLVFKEDGNIETKSFNNDIMTPVHQANAAAHQAANLAHGRTTGAALWTEMTIERGNFPVLLTVGERSLNSNCQHGCENNTIPIHRSGECGCYSVHWSRNH
jgi:hypothetical protein